MIEVRVSCCAGGPIGGSMGGPMMTEVSVTCGGASMGPASGGPSSRRVIGGGVRRGGPWSTVVVVMVGVMAVGMARSSSSPRRLMAEVPVRVVVECVVTVTRVVSSAEVDDVVVEAEVDSVQVSVLEISSVVPLTAPAVVEVVALVDGGDELGSKVDVRVCVAGPHESRVQL